MKAPLFQQPAAGDMVITALGMNSSLGLVVQSCAAARAGLSRWVNLDVDAADDDEVLSVPLQGHAVQGFTDGFAGLGRFLRLGELALGDLLQYGALAASDLREAHFLLHLPDDTYDEAWFERYGSPPLTGSAAERVRRQQHAERTAFREHVVRRLWPELLFLQGIRSDPKYQSVSFGGPAHFVGCLLQARHLLASRRAKLCILGGIDSYVSGDTLEQLHQLGLIQHGHNPDGFFPGEAAAFLAVERFDTARARGARIEACISSEALTREERTRFSGHAPQGVGLFQAIASACRGLGGAAPVVPRAVGNLNGSSYRANEFGHALVRLRGMGLPNAFQQWLPAESFGELGAATGPVAICMAVRAFARGYARSPQLLIWLSSDGDDRGAFFLRDAASGENRWPQGGTRR